ncbi:MAG: glycosyltransferase family 9 protein, partial [Bdellovibrio sp.]
MKILVVSLLRLGDLIQQEPLLRGLRKKNPGAEIHVLINTQLATAESLFAGVVDHFFYFDRESLQRGLGEANYNLLWSYTQLEGLVAELSAQKYDQIFNFTHNKLSAYVIGAIQAQDKRGLFQQDGRFQGLDNRWLRYFNDRFAGTQRSLFHYVELLGNAFAISTDRKAVEPRGKSKLVLFQCLTSDEKKNWGLAKFLQLKSAIEEALVDYKVCILGAPFEREKLAQLFGESNLLVCGLSEAKEHLKKAALLVTGDTSIKHLAAQLGTPVVELALGSSDWTKTAAFSEGTRILSGNAACAPCGHSVKCSQKSHLCADEISVDQVFAAVWDQLSHGPQKQTLETRDLERVVWSVYLDNKNAMDESVLANAALELVKKFGAEN